MGMKEGRGPGPHKVLVVDDDADLRKTLNIQLSGSYAVFEAGNGKEALLVIERERPHLMVLDMSMPEMGGLETLAAALDKHKEIVVIMLTGETDLDAAKRALDIGAAQYVTKPFDSKDLLAEIDRLLLGRQEKDPDGPPWKVAP